MYVYDYTYVYTYILTHTYTWLEIAMNLLQVSVIFIYSILCYAMERLWSVGWGVYL